MKVIKAALLVLGVVFTCLPHSYAQGMLRGDSAAAAVELEDDGDEPLEGEEDEESFERLLTKKRLKKRCAYPGELDRDLFECDETSLFKPDRWCKKYCFVCPCWDQETYYDWKGNEIEDVCSDAYCGSKDPKLPCSKHKGYEECCDCFKCKFLESFHWLDHPICTPPVPPKDCEETTPQKNKFGEYFCDADCPGDAVCVPDKKGHYCSCKAPIPSCEDLVPDNDGKCPGMKHVNALSTSSGCHVFLNSPSLILLLPGDCPFTREVCMPSKNGKGCTCKPDCKELGQDSQGRCRGV